MTSLGGNGDHLLAFGALACTGLMAYPKRPIILLADLLADALGLALGWGVMRLVRMKRRR
jgi:hypothetical protein